jgi:hypothetical protein
MTLRLFTGGIVAYIGKLLLQLLVVDGPDGLWLHQVYHLLEVSVGVETAIFISLIWRVESESHVIEVNGLGAVTLIN